MQANPHKHQHSTTNHTKTAKNICILQINSITNKDKELKQLAHTIQPNSIRVQVLTTTSKTFNIQKDTITHADRIGK